MLIHLAAAAAVSVLALISTHLVCEVPDSLLSALCLVELLTFSFRHRYFPPDSTGFKTQTLVVLSFSFADAPRGILPF